MTFNSATLCTQLCFPCYIELMTNTFGRPEQQVVVVVVVVYIIKLIYLHKQKNGRRKR